MRLDGRVAVVTGGSQGIGEAISRRYAREGAAVAILNRDHDAGATVAASITAAGGRAAAVACHVSDVGALGDAVSAVHVGLGPVDVLVNNAGAFVMSPLGGTDEEAFDLMIGANPKGLFFLSQAVLPDFRGGRTRQGHQHRVDLRQRRLPRVGDLLRHHVGRPHDHQGPRPRPAGAEHPGQRHRPGVHQDPPQRRLPRGQRRLPASRDERFGGPGVWMEADELTGAAVFLASEDADSVTGATL